MEIHRDILVWALQKAVEEEEKRLKKLFDKDFNPVYLEVWRLAKKALREPGAQIHIKD